LSAPPEVKHKIRIFLSWIMDCWYLKFSKVPWLSEFCRDRLINESAAIAMENMKMSSPTWLTSLEDIRSKQPTKIPVSMRLN